MVMNPYQIHSTSKNDSNYIKTALRKQRDKSKDEMRHSNPYQGVEESSVMEVSNGMPPVAKSIIAVNKSHLNGALVLPQHKNSDLKTLTLNSWHNRTNAINHKGSHIAEPTKSDAHYSEDIYQQKSDGDSRPIVARAKAGKTHQKQFYLPLMPGVKKDDKGAYMDIRASYKNRGRSIDSKLPGPQ